MYILGILTVQDDPLNKHRDFQCSLAGLGPTIEPKKSGVIVNCMVMLFN